ncbi:hypothetical protein DFO58_0864 [Arthrobacter sp. AG1021]|uniref:DUF6578 domain-containing protein n=1 Tax=Arthrobacter sp. AG1021 TaxID=2183908 RepID=UPI000EAFC18A|nr:hypothetical protein [Arthrobacter sp. AG1021]RKS22816.1 hypothetical protein DFO58_0864 [Arthrobacter sp. AG1021]
MQIELEIYGALHACCHPGFEVGQQVQWEIARLRHPDGTVVYELDDHGTLSASGVPVAAVDGTVTEIHYIDHHYEPAMGAARHLLPTGEPARMTPTSSVPAGTDFDHDLIHATLQLQDPGQLPDICDWDPQLDCPAETGIREAAAREEFALSGAAAQLRELAEELARRYGHLAKVRSDVLGQASLLPRARGAGDVQWRLDFTDTPVQLVVEIAGVEFTYLPDTASIRQLEQMVEAVAAGRVRERQRAMGACLVLEMSIELTDGSTLTQRDTAQGIAAQESFSIIGPVGDRLARNGAFNPWA